MEILTKDDIQEFIYENYAGFKPGMKNAKKNLWYEHPYGFCIILVEKVMKKRHHSKFFIMDPADMEMLKLSTISKKENYYQISPKNCGNVYLHRAIINREFGALSPGLVVDHINGCTWDNRRCNLREVSYKINARNRTKKKHRFLTCNCA